MPSSTLESDELVPADELMAEDRVHSRSVTLSSETHGLIATIDLVEADGCAATPVDYKRGAPPKDRQTGELNAWDPDRVQVAVQALVLRDNGYLCDEAVVYYVKTKQRVRVPIDDPLLARDARGRRRGSRRGRFRLHPSSAGRQPQVPAVFAGRHLPAGRDPFPQRSRRFLIGRVGRALAGIRAARGRTAAPPPARRRARRPATALSQHPGPARRQVGQRAEGQGEGHRRSGSAHRRNLPGQPLRQHPAHHPGGPGPL